MSARLATQGLVALPAGAWEGSVEVVNTEIALTAVGRSETYQGRPHRVYSAVLVRSQVLHNNIGRLFLPAEQLTDEWAQMWNGIPVLIGEHPTQHGQAISARTPEILGARGVGVIFNARIEQESSAVRRLVAEVWLDESRVGAVAGFQAVLDRVGTGATVELSTGFSTNVERQVGVFAGESYEAVMRPVGDPDHLVISTEMTGACSTADGCGLGANCGCGGKHKEAVVEQAQPEPTKPKGLKAVWAKVTELLSSEPVTLSREELEARRIQRELEVINAMNPSDQERMNILRDALQASLGGPDRQVIVTDVFSSEGKVIYWFSTPIGAFPAGSEYFQTTYTLNPDTGATSFGTPVRVRRMTTYETVAANAAGEPAGNAEVAAATNAETPTPGKESTTMAGNEKEGMEALVAQVTALATQVGTLSTQLTELARQGTPAEIAGLKRTVGALAEKFDAMQSVTTAAVEERERERQALVQELAGNHRVAFSAAELETMPIETLRKLQATAAGENHAGRGGPQGGKPGSEQRFMAPTPYHVKDESKGGK